MCSQDCVLSFSPANRRIESRAGKRKSLRATNEGSVLGKLSGSRYRRKNVTMTESVDIVWA